MGLKKWLMKQQWRIVQIRGIWGLFYGVLLLAISYYGYIPLFADMGSYGPFVFSGVLLFSFLILGYLYDRVFIMWAPSQEVSMERNPYQYVPSPKDHIFWLPIYSVLLNSAQALAEQFEVDTQEISDAKQYFAKWQKLRPELKKDIDMGAEMRNLFISGHSFHDILRETDDERK
ncbi:MAG: hypothetical protein ACXACD_04050 [Candidatus Thorarchaeota archaeon]